MFFLVGILPNYLFSPHRCFSFIERLFSLRRYSVLYTHAILFETPPSDVVL